MRQIICSHGILAALMLLGWTTVATANGCPAPGSTVASIEIDGISCVVEDVTVTTAGVHASGCADCVFRMFDTMVLKGDVLIEGFALGQSGTQSGGNCAAGPQLVGNTIVKGDLQLIDNEFAVASCNQVDKGNLQIEQNGSANVFVNNVDKGDIEAVDNGGLFMSLNSAAGDIHCENNGPGFTVGNNATGDNSC